MLSDVGKASCPLVVAGAGLVRPLDVRSIEADLGGASTASALMSACVVVRMQLCVRTSLA